MGLKFEDFVEICDVVGEEQPEVFGPQIELDLGVGSSIHDLGEPPVEDDGEVQVVEVIEEETPVEMGTGDEPVLEAVEMRTRLSLFMRMWRWEQEIRLFIGMRRVILSLRITRGMILKRWEKSTLRKPTNTLGAWSYCTLG